MGRTGPNYHRIRGSDEYTCFSLKKQEKILTERIDVHKIDSLVWVP